jgi:hypothetical protein
MLSFYHQLKLEAISVLLCSGIGVYQGSHLGEGGSRIKNSIMRLHLLASLCCSGVTIHHTHVGPSFSRTSLLPLVMVSQWQNAPRASFTSLALLFDGAFILHFHQNEIRVSLLQKLLQAFNPQ